jgi:hypothetical protein
MRARLEHDNLVRVKGHAWFVSQVNAKMYILSSKMLNTVAIGDVVVMLGLTVRVNNKGQI